MSIAYYKSEKTSLESKLGELNRENYSTDLLFKPNNNWILGGGHRSAILNVDRLELQTNGIPQVAAVIVATAEEQFEIYVDRSYGRYLADWLADTSNIDIPNLC